VLVVPPSHNHKNRFLIYNHGFQTCWRNQITGHNKTKWVAKNIYIRIFILFYYYFFFFLSCFDNNQIWQNWHTKNIINGRNKIIQKVVYFLFVFFFFNLGMWLKWKFTTFLIILLFPLIYLFIFSRVFFPLKNNNICHKWFFFV